MSYKYSIFFGQNKSLLCFKEGQIFVTVLLDVIKFQLRLFIADQNCVYKYTI